MVPARVTLGRGLCKPAGIGHWQGGAKRPPPVPLTNLSMAKKLCTTAPAVIEQRKSLHICTSRRLTPDANTPPEMVSCMTNKNSMLASSQIFKTPEKPRTTLTKVLTTLGSPGSTRNKFATPTVTKIAQPRQTLLPDDLGECISGDAAAVSHLGWEEFVQRRRGRDDFAGLGNLCHPARRLLRQYKFRGAPVVMAGKDWTDD